LIIGFGFARIARMLRIPGSGLAATVARLAARAMSAFHEACRPSGIAGGFIADLTRSRAELLAENAFLRQQLRPSRSFSTQSLLMEAPREEDVVDYQGNGTRFLLPVHREEVREAHRRMEEADPLALSSQAHGDRELAQGGARDGARTR
jgi:hypothetical protein